MQKGIGYGLILCLLLGISGCAHAPARDTFATQTIGVITGTEADTQVTAVFPAATLRQYTDFSSALAALHAGEIAAIADEIAPLRRISAQDKALALITDPLTKTEYGFAVNSSAQQTLLSRVNETLAALKQNGTYRDMEERWFPPKGDPSPMPDLSMPIEGKPLRIGVFLKEPFAFWQNGALTGFDIELATRVALTLGVPLEMVELTEHDWERALVDDRVDLVCSVMKPEKPSDHPLFSDATYLGGIGLLTLAK